MGDAASAGTDKTDLLDDILEEVKRLREVEAARAPRRVHERVGRIRRRRADSRARGPAIAIACGIALVVAAGYLAFRYVTISVCEQSARVALRRAEFVTPGIETDIESADKDRKAGRYRDAWNAYRSVLTRAERVSSRLRKAVSGLPDGELKQKVLAILKQLESYAGHCREALNSPDVKYGSQGLVEFEGQWVTPERRQELFEAKMRAEGRRLYKGRWLTEAEIHEAKGEILYNGKWIKKEEYAKLIAGGGEKPSVAPKPHPKPPPRLPRRRSAEELAILYPPTRPRWVIDDFESGLEWTNVTWTNVNPCKISIVKGSDGNCLLIETVGGKNDKSAIVRPLGMDFSTRSRLSLDVVNECGEPVRIAIAIETDAYYESRWRTLKIGRNEGVTFDLRAGDYKSRATHWAHATRIGKPSSAAWLYLLVYYDRPGKIKVDNILALGAGP